MVFVEAADQLPQPLRPGTVEGENETISPAILTAAAARAPQKDAATSPPPPNLRNLRRLVPRPPDVALLTLLSITLPIP